MDQLRALQGSVARLRGLVEPLDAEGIRAPAYPSEWSIADVLSHLGSGGAMMLMQLDAFLAARSVPDDFAQPIWDEWNAKTPEGQVADSLAVDRAMLGRVNSLTDEQVARFELELGPLRLDLTSFLGLRLNEHALHTWDIEVVLDPAATVAQGAVDLVVDNLGMIVGFVGKPTGRRHDIHIRTAQPARDFTLALGNDGAALTACEGRARRRSRAARRSVRALGLRTPRPRSHSDGSGRRRPRRAPTSVSRRLSVPVSR